MTKKVLRTIYLTEDLDARLLGLAEKEHSSVSRLVRIALERHLEENGVGSAGTSETSYQETEV